MYPGHHDGNEAPYGSPADATIYEEPEDDDLTPFEEGPVRVSVM